MLVGQDRQGKDEKHAYWWPVCTDRRRRMPVVVTDVGTFVGRTDKGMI